MPCSRHKSATLAPASFCLGIARIWLSEYLDFFIENLCSKCIKILYFSLLLLFGGITDQLAQFILLRGSGSPKHDFPVLVPAVDTVDKQHVEVNIQDVIILGLIILIRTFLSFTLQYEIEGRWPWQHQKTEKTR